MRRRDFLVSAATILGAAPGRPVLAQGSAGERAAVVIGVNRAGDLPVLNAAVSGAEQISNWLNDEGFDVKLFVDKTESVEAKKIFDSVSEIVKKGTITQLVIYFAGHGFVTAYSEFWLLSNAPENPNEAISLLESVLLAKQSAIPNVVFISDACRSTSDSLSTTRVKGSVIFPNRRVQSRSPPAIDLFLATLVGDPAWEIPVSQSVPRFQGIYTASFLSAFEHPTEEMVLTVDGVKVIPNRKMGDYLLREVPKRAQAKSIKLNQLPDSNITCGDTVYIGRVLGPAAASTGPRPERVITVQDVAQVEIAEGISGRHRPTYPTPEYLEASLDFFHTKSTIRDARMRPVPAAVDTGTGFSISGAGVKSVAATPGMKAVILNLGDGAEPALVQIYPEGQRAGSVALQFADGSGTVVAGLANFTGNVVVDNGGVINVSYVPAQGSFRWPEYQSKESSLREFRSAVATAAKFGVFRIQDEKQAAALADRVRLDKGIDPTLGIYAAYAYDQAGIHRQVLSVREIMRGDLDVDIFDVAMLADGLPGNVVDSHRVVPFCPTLSQGWNFLRVKQVSLPPAVAEARDDLRPALWTTFGAQGMTTLMRSNLWG